MSAIVEVITVGNGVDQYEIPEWDIEDSVKVIGGVLIVYSDEGKAAMGYASGTWQRFEVKYTTENKGA